MKLGIAAVRAGSRSAVTAILPRPIDVLIWVKALAGLTGEQRSREAQVKLENRELVPWVASRIFVL